MVTTMITISRAKVGSALDINQRAILLATPDSLMHPATPKAANRNQQSGKIHWDGGGQPEYDGSQQKRYKPLRFRPHTGDVQPPEDKKYSNAGYSAGDLNAVTAILHADYNTIYINV